MKSIIFALYKQFVTLGLGTSLGRSEILSALHAQIVSLLKPEFVNFEGFKIFLDKKDSRRLTRSEKDISLETKIIRKVIKGGDTVLDIGAHIGYFSLVMGDLVGRRGKVFAFEPSNENFLLLKKNIKVNGLRNVKPINFAVANYEGTGRLFLSSSSSADHSLSGDGNRFEKVKVISLGKYFKNYKEKINFVKIDVQGAELQVLLGMQKLLKKNPQIKIICEFWPKGITQSGFDPEEYLKLLNNLGFKIYNINEWKGIELTSPGKLLKKYTVKNNLDTNLFCIKTSNKINLSLKSTIK